MSHAPVEAPLACEDCGLLYADFGLDVDLPRSQWVKIVPKEPPYRGVYLCANCIVKRLAKVPGVTCAHLIAEVSPWRSTKRTKSRLSNP